MRMAGASNQIAGQIAGVLSGVDLDALVSEQFPHRLSGLADIRIDEATFAAGKLTAARGTFEASGGAVSRSLLAAAAEHLGLTAAERALAGPAEQLGFRRLAVGFELRGTALLLSGQADPRQDNVVMATASGPLLASPPGHAVPAIQLLRTLLPESGFQVPATRQTERLLSLLPLPEAPAAIATRLPPHVPTRLAPSAADSPRTAVQQPVLR
jgi:hypothetical protein